MRSTGMALFDQMRPFPKKFKPRPETADEIRDCKQPLSPKELIMVTGGPKTIDFGTVRTAADGDEEEEDAVAAAADDDDGSGGGGGDGASADPPPDAHHPNFASETVAPETVAP